MQFWLHVVKLPCGSVGCLHSLPTQDVPDCATCSSRQGCGDLFVEPVVHLTIEMLIFFPSPNFWSLVLLGQYLLHMSMVGCCKRHCPPSTFKKYVHMWQKNGREGIMQTQSMTSKLQELMEIWSLQFWYNFQYFTSHIQ